MKMIMALPSHIDGEKFINTTMDVIKGRYGKNGYYSGVMPYASIVIRPEKISTVFAHGFSSKNGLHYYEIDASELDPVIIATMEEFGEFCGMRYRFVCEGKSVRKDWWKPNYQFQYEPYCECESLDIAREDYDTMLASFA